MAEFRAETWQGEAIGTECGDGVGYISTLHICQLCSF